MFVSVSVSVSVSVFMSMSVSVSVSMSVHVHECIHIFICTEINEYILEKNMCIYIV